jgi:hypothetical protein
VLRQSRVCANTYSHMYCRSSSPLRATPPPNRTCTS